jgi:hypothetical protein
MTRMIVDASLPEKLTHLVHPIELCDANGRVLGRYFPQPDPSEYHLEPQSSKEKLQRRKESSERTYTTAEVLTYLDHP